MYEKTTEKDVKLGGKIVVEFPTNAGSTGYIWEPTFYDEDLFEVKASSDTHPDSDTNYIGGSTIRRFEIKPKKKGRGIIEFREHQPWTKDSTEAIETYNVTVN